jgi:hypothetical protein
MKPYGKKEEAERRKRIYIFGSDRKAGYIREIAPKHE